jgi:hypothetical protein
MPLGCKAEGQPGEPVEKMSGHLVRHLQLGKVAYPAQLEIAPVGMASDGRPCRTDRDQLVTVAVHGQDGHRHRRHGAR